MIHICRGCKEGARNTLKSIAKSSSQFSFLRQKLAALDLATTLSSLHLAPRKSLSIFLSPRWSLCSASISSSALSLGPLNLRVHLGSLRGPLLYLYLLFKWSHSGLKPHYKLKTPQNIDIYSWIHRYVSTNLRPPVGGSGNNLSKRNS